MGTLAEYQSMGYVVKTPGSIANDTGGRWAITSGQVDFTETSENLDSGVVKFQNFGFSADDFPGVDPLDCNGQIRFIFTGTASGKNVSPAYDGFADTWLGFTGSEIGGWSGTDLPPVFAWDPTGMNATRDYYVLNFTRADISQIFETAFGFGLNAVVQNQWDQVYSSGHGIAMTATAVPVGSGLPRWLAPTFTPTGNSNWARVRMNPLLRM